MSELEVLIRAEINSRGPMRFDRFMDLALYHPGLGYYARPGGRRIGRTGDFFTSVSVGPLFGCLLARQFHQMWQKLGQPQPFWIIEQGAHDGRLAHDILDWCHKETPDFFAALRYAIVQPRIKSTPPEHLAEFSSVVHLFTDLAALSAVSPVGVFVSNELVDAFPVRVITHRSGPWLEAHVGLRDERLVWIDQPIADKELAHAVESLPLPAVDGYTTEINLRARDWIHEVGQTLHSGYVVTIDYGYLEEAYYAPHRSDGTLCAYVKHRADNDVLAEPGARDLTAHVDFTALVHAGKKAGLETLGFLDQQRFLTGIAHDELAGLNVPTTRIAENLRAWNTLTHPEFLGSRFHALVQVKDAPAQLDCLRFAREVQW